MDSPNTSPQKILSLQKKVISLLIDDCISKNIIESRDKVFYFNLLLGQSSEYQITKTYDRCLQMYELLVEQKNYLQALVELVSDVDANVNQKDLLNAKFWGLLMKPPSQYQQEFYNNYLISPPKATEEFYQMQKDVNYIQMERIKLNKHWNYQSKYGQLEITVNLSKPEKDPKDIAKIAQKTKDSFDQYPQCLLCIQNEGFYGNISHPGRANLRLIQTCEWLFQYSPYSYYNEHCIVLSPHHEMMKVSKSSLNKLLDLVDYLPHYFFGSNADLPIVGGSILNHDHFQGGRHKFAIMQAQTYANYSNADYKDINIELLNWPLSTVKISSANRVKLLNFADLIFTKWIEYSDSQREILSHTVDQNNQKIRHNTITPIVYQENNLYTMLIVLRNNRVNHTYPDGIFHPKQKYHHIKKENIGLIEVAGLAILPPRVLDNIYNGQYTNEYVGSIFEKVLEDCGVFKMNDDGKTGFDKFISSLNCQRIS